VRARPATAGDPVGMGACCSSKGHGGAVATEPRWRKAGPARPGRSQSNVENALWPQRRAAEGLVDEMALPDRRHLTSAFINSQESRDDVLEGANEPSEPSSPASACRPRPSLGERNLKETMSIVEQLVPGGASASADVDAILREVERLVDVEYDIMVAKLIIERSHGLLSQDQWAQITSSEVYHRYLRKLGYLYLVGQAVCDHGSDWFNVYRDAAGVQRIDGHIDKVDSTVFHYRVKVMIPVRLTNVMALANEIDLLPLWNKLLTGIPAAIGRRTGHYIMLQYQMAFAGGMYKFDILNEVRRFSDVEGGFLAEFIESADSAHPCYRKPSAGFKRPKTQLKNVWLACGEQHSLLLQVGKVKLPFTVSRWIASTIGGLAGRFVVDGLVKNSLRTLDPNNPWEKALREDVFGFYQRVEECVMSAASSSRAPKFGEKTPVVEDAAVATLLRGDVADTLLQARRSCSPAKVRGPAVHKTWQDLASLCTVEVDI